MSATVLVVDGPIHRYVELNTRVVYLIDRYVRAHKWKVEREDQDDDSRAGYCLLRSTHWTPDGTPSLPRAFRYALANGECGAAVVLGAMLVDVEVERVFEIPTPTMISGTIERP